MRQGRAEAWAKWRRLVGEQSESGLSLSPLTATAASNYNGNNQMVASGDFSYDAAGNQTFMSPYNVTYDGESRQTGITSAQNGSAAYTYDGRRPPGDEDGWRGDDGVRL